MFGRNSNWDRTHTYFAFFLLYTFTHRQCRTVRLKPKTVFAKTETSLRSLNTNPNECLLGYIVDRTQLLLVLARPGVDLALDLVGTALMSTYMWVSVGGSGTVVHVISSNTTRQTHTQIASCNLLLSASTAPHIVNIFTESMFRQIPPNFVDVHTFVHTRTALTVDYIRLKKVNFAPQ